MLACLLAAIPASIRRKEEDYRMEQSGSASIVKKVEGKHIAWFSSSNQWVRFEEPAWFVYRLLQKGYSPEEVTGRCTRKYKNPKRDSRQFVQDVMETISGIQSENPGSGVIGAIENSGTEEIPTPFSVHHYAINDKKLTIEYGSERFEVNLHPSLAHLEIPIPKTSDCRFVLFEERDELIIRTYRNKNRPLTWTFGRLDQLKGRVLIEILNTIYDRNDDDWMTIIHASAVTDGQSTILFSSACGSGKSTMAALLKIHGLEVVSDDIVPVDAKSAKIFPFPAALSIKEGSLPVLMPHFPELADAPYYRYTGSDKLGRYLPLKQALFNKSLINKARALVFIRHDTTVDFCWEELSRLEAISLFNEEAWLSPSPKNARRYINWFLKLPCYRLNYSENTKAVKAIMQLFQVE